MVHLLLDISHQFRIFRFSIVLLRPGTYFYYSLDAFSPLLRRAMYRFLLLLMLNSRLFWWIEHTETEQVHRLSYSNGWAEEKFCKNQSQSSIFFWLYTFVRIRTLCNEQDPKSIIWTENIISCIDKYSFFKQSMSVSKKKCLINN